MKRMNPAALCAALLALGAASCGGRQSVASKSAAAYENARKTGVAVSGDHHHGGHATEATTTTGEEHSMTGMHHGEAPMPEMDHGAMSGKQHAGMDHHAMPGMQHASTTHGEMHGMQHGEMSGMAHGSMPEMQHSEMHHPAASPNVAVVAEAPRTNSAMAEVRPEATLRTDDFDAPAPIAQSEAAKTTTTDSMQHHKEHP